MEIGLLRFHFSYAAQYSSVWRILSSNIRPTSLDTDVSSSAACFLAHRRASSLRVMGTDFNTDSVLHELGVVGHRGGTGHRLSWPVGMGLRPAKSPEKWWGRGEGPPPPNTPPGHGLGWG